MSVEWVMYCFNCGSVLEELKDQRGLMSHWFCSKCNRMIFKASINPIKGVSLNGEA